MLKNFPITKSLTYEEQARPKRSICWDQSCSVCDREVLHRVLLSQFASKLVIYGGRLGDIWESNKPLMLAAGFEITELDEELPGHKLSSQHVDLLGRACSS
ncbi:hypothetical protein Bca52824_072305 [Brassica carinata]|uniref:Uncharacterized protein n=2 Tax=Brassica TaxID=3705 RepID=A0A8X7Q7L4_BRACI|nr:hypothetical protein Bca52824_072305 [Brassica carinata]